ncbi:hypothetical protein [Cellulomonas sp. S1-8]|uniref:hypothetical protein n=1 Tax=Cellulomonas sp. S1-8 TaxID=2904790 RepID=UPI002243F6A0|nr:hypothetical protein [Cellulomonas sp. S1-8]UZN04653.1 hypothetical protein OKX07_06995 [Cellulomonas sp. S1-8]
MRLRELAAHAEELGFVPRPAVRWLDPPELARTALKAVLAQVFADYGDKREVQAALPAGPLEPVHRPDGDLWIDFTADLGDGFDATATVAALLAAPTLTVAGPDGPDGSPGIPRTLPRGHVLVLGGDEVYPAASARAYEDRTLGPYAAALPAPAPGTPRDATTAPTLLAVPGNHDWYDGLTSFLRVFARGAAIGGWRTVQRRSYGAMRLGHGWWLLLLDSQLGEYVDEPQLEHLRTHLTAHLRPGDAVVVCAAEPAWAHVADHRDAFDQLHFVERELVHLRRVPGRDEPEPTGAAVRLWLSGDSHHASRYAQRPPDGAHADGPAGAPAGRDPRSVQAVTCGLGGAYLGDTHRLPDHVDLPAPGARRRDDAPRVPFDRSGPTYPDRATSRRLARRVANPCGRWWAGRRNPGLLVALGCVQLVLVVALAAVLDLVRPGAGVVTVRATPASDAARFAAVVLTWGAALVVVHVVAARLAPRGRLASTVPASVGLVLQLAAGLTGLVLLTALPWPAAWSSAGVVAGVVVVAWAAGALLGTQAFALLLVSRRTGAVASWQMSGQSVDDHKGFLRLHLRADGALVLHTLVVDAVCRDWEVARDAAGARPVPAGGLPRVRLLEEPLVIARKGFAP